MRRYRVTVEVELPDNASADDALVWASKILRIGRIHWTDGQTMLHHDGAVEPREHRVVSVAPVGTGRQ